MQARAKRLPYPTPNALARVWETYRYLQLEAADIKRAVAILRGKAY